HLVASRVSHDRAVKADDVVYASLAGFVAVVSQSDVGVCYHEVKAHLFEKLCAYRLPYRMDNRHKCRRLNYAVRRLELAYSARKIRVPDLEHNYFLVSFIKSS